MSRDCLLFEWQRVYALMFIAVNVRYMCRLETSMPVQVTPHSCCFVLGALIFDIKSRVKKMTFKGSRNSLSYWPFALNCARSACFVSDYGAHYLCVPNFISILMFIILCVCESAVFFFEKTLTSTGTLKISVKCRTNETQK